MKKLFQSLLSFPLFASPFLQCLLERFTLSQVTPSLEGDAKVVRLSTFANHLPHLFYNSLIRHTIIFLFFVNIA
jgi:hypothetical protein